METSISFRKRFLSTLLLLFITQKVASFSRTGFACRKEDLSKLPELPEAFSANVRANFLMEGYTVDIKYAVNKKEKKELFDIKTTDRRVQYILRGDQKAALKITFKEDDYPVCVVEKTEDISEIMDSKDTGPSGILQKTISIMKNPGNKFSPQTDTQDGIFAQLWEGCLGEPRINVSFSIAPENWKHPYGSTKKVNYVGRGEAQIDNAFMTAYFSNFDPTTPDNSLFQPPEDVYCAGLKSTEEFPVIQDFFSYNAEIVTYVSAAALAPIISHRTVYYDYPAGIARVDFYDALAEDADIFAPIIAQEKSVIHDFNAGVQYSFDMLRGKCTPDSFKSTFSVISYVETKDNKMLNGKEYLWLDNAELSYNGQFPVRGVKADVYTSIKVDPQTNKNAVVSWYFSSRETRVVEDVNVEQNVLLRMSVRPETGFGKQGVVVINFYDFVNEEPSVLSYDLTRCYNETSSKLLVLTFPTNPLLRGSEKLIGMLAHIAIRTTTGVSKQRIAVREVALNDKYLFVEFYLLDTPSKDSKETSLDDAVKKLEKAVIDGKITLAVPVGKEMIKLSPEPDGLNVFAGDRIRRASITGYKEGSVVSMAIGLLLLGFLLGGVTLNLIMSRKFGVSLFQKSKYGSGGPFSDSHESPL